MASVLVISPKSDPATEVSYLAAEALTRVLRKQGHKVKRLKGYWIEAGVVQTWLRLHSRSKKLVCYFGHGLPDEMVGRADTKVPGWKPILDLQTVGCLKNCIVYSASCYTGCNLGVEAEEHCISYMGFNRTIFVSFNKPERNYMNDWIEMFTVFPLLVANGSTTREAFSAFLRKCDDYMSYYGSVALDFNKGVDKQLRDDGKFPNADYYFSRTLNNKEAAILYGSWDASL